MVQHAKKPLHVVLCLPITFSCLFLFLYQNACTCHIWNCLEHLKFHKLSLLDLYKQAERKGMMSKHSLKVTVIPLFLHSAFTAVEKLIYWTDQIYNMKQSYIHNNIKTLLSRQYRKIDQTVTSLLMMQNNISVKNLEHVFLNYTWLVHQSAPD